MRWQPGQHVVRREVWNGKPWMASDAIVVRDEPDELVLFTPTGAPMTYADGDWPTADGKHPWHQKPRWHGHGALQIHEPGEDYAVWVFWSGPERALDCWYLNLQAPYVRTELGIDTLDHEVDVVVRPDGEVVLKDVDSIADCVRYGRFSQDFADQVVQRGRELAERVATKGIWWDPAWAAWTPPDDWRPRDALGMRDASTFGDVHS